MWFCMVWCESTSCLVICLYDNLVVISRSILVSCLVSCGWLLLGLGCLVVDVVGGVEGYGFE